MLSRSSLLIVNFLKFDNFDKSMNTIFKNKPDWKKIMKHLPSQQQSFLNQMKFPQVPPELHPKFEKKLKAWSQFTSSEYPRSNYFYSMILLAFRHDNNPQYKLFRKHIISIVSFKGKIQKQISFFPLLVLALGDAFAKELSFDVKRRKKSQYKIKLFQLLTVSLQNFETYEEIKCVLQLFEELINFNTSLSDTFRMARLNDIISKKIMDIEKNKGKVISKSSKLNFYFSYLKITKDYNLPKQVEDFFVQLTFSPSFFQAASPHLTLTNLFLLYKLYPAVKPKDPALYHEFKGNYKNKFLKIIGQKCKQEEYNLILAEYNKKHLGSIFYSYIQSIFVYQFFNLSREHIQGYSVITSEAKKPTIQPFLLKLYQLSEQYEIENSSIIASIMLQLYPEHVSEKYKVKRNKKSLRKTTYNRDNDMTVVVDHVLQNLGIEFQRETLFMGRYVDFLIEKNIVLQCDGYPHFDFKNYHESERTAFRNFTYLSNGYKILVLSIYEYNLNRSTSQIEEIIKNKLSILKQNNVYLVQ